MDKFNNFLRGVSNVFYTFLVANVVYFTGLMGTQLTLNAISPKIRSQYQLEQLVERERMNIDPQNNHDISVLLLAEDKASSKKLAEGRYQIDLGGSFATVTTLKHELYHVLNKHNDVNEKTDYGYIDLLRYLYYFELQATAYQLKEQALDFFK